MPTEILMPALSPTMEEGTLAKWLVKEGDTVKSGDLLAEIETDKATMEFEAVDEGVIGKILIAEGTENVKVNTAIAVLLADGESASDIGSAPAAPTPAAAPAAAATPAASATPVATPAVSHGARVFASPLARRIAADKGIDLGSLTGSGPHGRIVKADVENATAAPKAASAPAPSAPVAAAPKPAAPQVSAEGVAKLYADREYTEIPLDGMRKTIAARLSEAKQTIPHFYLRRDIKLDALMAFRAQINKQLESRGVKLSVNDFIIKACANALQAVPAANAVWAGDRVSSEMKDLAGRARNKKLAPHEYQGGSFAISNLGMFGIDNFDAVINPPHGAILAVGAGVKKPVVGDDGQISVATVMSVTLSVDHRVIDGALGAELLKSIVDNLENPMGMLA
jgi:pyruvate dehydrogenase E2 component (dihydrolipoamide acetyltransferase)